MLAKLRTPRIRLALEELESRLVPTGPSNLEQQMLEELNAIRANPAAYGQSIGLDLSTVAPSQPLAFIPGLIASAEGHSLDMSDNDYFSHTAPDGTTPGDRMTADGVLWVSYGESIAAGYPTTAAALQGLIIDAGVPDLGHRVQLLAETTTFQAEQEVGVGVVMNGSGSYSDYYTIDTTQTNDTRPYLTGVVYNDANNNSQYDAGEGLGGVTLSIAGVGTMTTWSSGGYSWQLSPGTYTVTASGPGLSVPVTKTVTLTTQNVELDFLAPSVSAATASNDAAWVQQEYQTLLHRGGSQADVNYWTNLLMQGESQAAVVAAFEGSAEFANDSKVWVQSIYQDVLGRAATTSDLNYWVGLLQAGQSPSNVAAAIDQSAEAQQDQWTALITQAYQNLLKRSPLASDLSYWIGQFKAGMTPTTFTAEVASSPEFTAQLGGSVAANWVANLYGDLLQRGALASDISYWTGVLQSGVSRLTVVEMIEQSGEYQQLQRQAYVQGLYQTLLHRTGSSADVAYWVAQMANGASQETILVNFVLSSEFYTLAMG